MRPFPAVVIIGLVALVIGQLAYILDLRGALATNRRPTIAAPAPPIATPLAPAHQREERTSPRPIPAPPSTAAQPPAPVDATALADLSRRKLLHVSLRLLGPDGRVSDGVAELFALTPEARARLDRDLTAARIKLRRLTKQNTTRTEPSPGVINLTIEPFIDQGARIYDEVSSALMTAVGADRMPAFQALAGNQLETQFNYFGAEARHVEITTTNEAGQNSIAVVDRHERGVERNSTTSQFRTAAELAQHFPDLMDQLTPPAGDGPH